MGGYSSYEDCQRCGSKDSVEFSTDDDDVSGYCLECGYSFRTVYSIAILDEVNEERKSMELPILAELKKPVEGWKDDTDPWLQQAACDALNALFWKLPVKVIEAPFVSKATERAKNAEWWIAELRANTIFIQWDENKSKFVPGKAP